MQQMQSTCQHRAPIETVGRLRFCELFGVELPRICAIAHALRSEFGSAGGVDASGAFEEENGLASNFRAVTRPENPGITASAMPTATTPIATDRKSVV